MFGFGKKKDTEIVNAGKPPKLNVGKKSDGMRSVLQLSVLENRVDEAKSNTRFVTKRHGNECYAVIALSTEKIGGLSKKDSKNSDKGLFVRSVSGGSTSIIVTDELLDQEMMVFIPNELTIETLSGWKMFRDNEFDIWYLFPDGHFEQDDELKSIPFTKIEDMVEGDVSFDITFGEEEEDRDEDSEELSTEDEEALNSMNVSNDIPTVNISENSTSKEGSEDVGLFNSESEEENDTSDADDFDEQIKNLPDSMYSESYGVEEETVPSIEDNIEYSEEDVNKALQRRFQSDSLKDLKFNRNNFDVLMEKYSDSALILFDESDEAGKSLLGDEVLALKKNCNTKLKRLRDANIGKLFAEYEAFMNFVSTHVLKEIETSNETTTFGQMLASIKESHDERELTINADIDAVKQELDEKYENEKKAFVDAQIKSFELSFDQRHKSEFEAKLKAESNRIRSDVSESYERDLIGLEDKKKEYARAIFDQMETACLNKLAGKLTEMYDEEHALYEDLGAKIIDWIKTNRANDVFAKKLEAEQLLKNDTIQALKDEHKIFVENLETKYASQLRSTESELDTVRKSFSDYIDTKTAEIKQLKVDIEERRKESKQDLADLAKQKDNIYSAQINRLEREIDSWKAVCEEEKRSAKKSRVGLVAIFIVALFAAICIGAIIGTKFGVDIYRSIMTNLNGIPVDGAKAMIHNVMNM